MHFLNTDVLNTEVLYTPQDAVKLCFQAAFGAEHGLSDISKARNYFNEEYDSLEASDSKLHLIEPISDEVIRVNMAPWKRLALPAEWLFNLFAAPLRGESSQVVSKNNTVSPERVFDEYIKKVQELARTGKFVHFSLQDFEDYMELYRGTWVDGKPHAVSHSEIYRKREKPAYRIVSHHYIRLLPILQALSGRDSAVIAIDGRAASGKSTLAQGLKEVIGAELIHMDDFFLPMELRTKDRFETPGGNIHYERFKNEVLPLIPHKAFSHRIFSCQTMDFAGLREIKPSPWLVVEGAYSHHPYFADYMDLRVFSDIQPDLQISRITDRNGKEMAAMFKDKWIPMEEKYMKKFHIQDYRTLTISCVPCSTRAPGAGD